MGRMSTLVEHSFEIENLHERMRQAEEQLENIQLHESDTDRIGREVDDLRQQITDTQRVVLNLSLETARAVQRLYGLVEQCSDAIGALPAEPEQLRITGGNAIEHQEIGRIKR